MQPRSLDAILAELGSTYNPQIASVRQRQAMVPQEVDADIKAAEGAKSMAYDDILGGARRRGMGFSGIPLGEQAQYASNVFAPQVLKAKSAGRERALNLEDAILGIQERRNTLAQQMRAGEVDHAEKQRQFNESLAYERQKLAANERQAALDRQSMSYSRPTVTPTQAPAAQQQLGWFQKKPTGGFAFADQGGKSISAAKWAQLNNKDVRDVLYQMGEAGDRYSQQLYNQLAADKFFGRGDGNYDRRIMQTYSPIFWGTF